MALADLLSRTATITRRTADATDRDEYGDEIIDTATTTVSCELQQRQRGETADGTVAASGWFAVFPADTTLDAGDAVEIDGTSFEVDGPPWVVKNARTGVASHIEATLTVAGGVR